MAEHKCEAIVITCIDFRFQEYIDKFLKENFKPGTYDRGAFAGAAKSLETILDQVEISSRLHNIHRVVLVNHEDCGAYGKKGDLDHHIEDLNKAREEIKAKFSNLEVDTNFLYLNGTFEKVNP